MESAELHFEGNMEDEEWEVWIAKIKTVATEILGFKVGEIEKGEVVLNRLALDTVNLIINLL
ncbi:MAG: hypothetical protein CL613_04550 [Aquimarina sp.]|nr:hypothetical protein [Aquimarina sp.]